MPNAEPKPQVTNNKDIALMPPGRHRVENETGLYLYVTPGGDVRRWIFRFTSPLTKRVTETGLDMASVVSLAQAKDKAQALRKQIANGICPIHAKREARASEVTFCEAADQWIAVHKSSWKGGDNSSQMCNANLLLHHHGKMLATVRVSEVTPDRVQKALEALWQRTPNQGRRALAMWERVFDFAKSKGWRQGDNPAEWRGLMQYRFPRQRKSDRGHYAALAYEEMPDFIRTLRQRQVRSTGAVALEFLILTASRTGEVLGMKWSEIDWDKKLWNLPAERTKQGRAHTVPLSARALAILEQQKLYRNGSEFVFAGKRQTQMESKVLVALLRFMEIDVTVHGMRATFRTWTGNETNFSRVTCELALGHQCGSSIELAYRRGTELEKRRVLMEAWASYVNGDAHDNREAA